MNQSKIILALQFCHKDKFQALELARLVADLQPDFTEEAELLLFSAHNLGEPVADQNILNTVNYCSSKFRTTMQRCSRREEGYPAGPNGMACDLFQYAWTLKRDEKTGADCVLAFEADCTPCTKDWWQRIYQEWKSSNMFISGAKHDDHVNGNMVFDIRLGTKQGIWGCPSDSPWDMHFASIFLPISHASTLIYNDYKKPTATEADIFAPRNGTFPALIHGIQDGSGQRMVRTFVVDGKPLFPEPKMVMSPIGL